VGTAGTAAGTTGAAAGGLAGALKKRAMDVAMILAGKKPLALKYYLKCDLFGL
jgi:hypothetical protein